MNKAEFNRACDALLLEVAPEIVKDIRRIGHGYAAEVSRKRAVDFGDVLCPHTKIWIGKWYNEWLKEQKEQHEKP